MVEVRTFLDFAGVYRLHFLVPLSGPDPHFVITGAKRHPVVHHPDRCGRREPMDMPKSVRPCNVEFVSMAIPGAGLGFTIRTKRNAVSFRLGSRR